MDDLTRLNFSNVLESCQIIKDYLRRSVLGSNENQRGFYVSLPKLCSVIFGSRDKRGWIHRPLRTDENNALLDLLKPTGEFVRALLKLYHERGFVYEMVPDKLPPRTQQLLNPQRYQFLPVPYNKHVQLTNPISAQHVSPYEVYPTTSRSQGLLRKQSPQPTEEQSVKLMFNMFEYYMFYFVYAVTMGSQVGQTPDNRQGYVDMDNTAYEPPPMMGTSSFSTSTRFGDTTNLSRRNGIPNDPWMSMNTSTTPSVSSTGTLSQQTYTSRLQPQSRPRALHESAYKDLLIMYLSYFCPSKNEQSSQSKDTSAPSQEFRPATSVPTSQSSLRLPTSLPSRPSSLGGSSTPRSVPFRRSPFSFDAGPADKLPGPTSTATNPSSILPPIPSAPSSLTSSSIKTGKSTEYPYYFTGLFEDPELDLQNRNVAGFEIAEFFIGCCVDLWVGQNQWLPVTEDALTNLPPSTRDRQGGSSSVSSAYDSISQASSAKAWTRIEYVVPTPDWYWCMTVLVKYHGQCGVKGMFEDLDSEFVHGQGSVEDVVRLTKRNYYSLLHDRLYYLLKWCALSSGPEDLESVIRLWCTYISPWKYDTDYEIERKKERPRRATLVEAGYGPFILDNYLFYSGLLPLFLARTVNFAFTDFEKQNGKNVEGTLKADLTIVNAIIQTFRFKGLIRLLDEAEKVLMGQDSYGPFLTIGGSSSTPLSGKGFSATSGTSSAGKRISSGRRRSSSGAGGFGHIKDIKPETPECNLVAYWLPTMRQQIAMLEGPSWKCPMIFCRDEDNKIRNPAAVQQLLWTMRGAIQWRAMQIRELKPSPATTNPGDEDLWDTIKKTYTTVSTYFSTNNATADSEVKRLEKQIEALKELAGSIVELFGFSSEDLKYYTSTTDIPTGPLSALPSSVHGGQSQPQLYAQLDPMQYGYLTPEGRVQVKRGLRKCNHDDIPLMGTRAREYIMSYELGWLVHLTLKGETVLDNWVADLIQTLIGKGVNIPQRFQHPHIPLRWLADYRNLLFLFIVSLFWSKILWPILTFFFGSSSKPKVAYTPPPARHPRPTRVTVKS